METVTITINLTVDEDEDIEERKDLIVSNLKLLIDSLEETGGDIKELKGEDKFSTITYIHTKN